MKLEGLFLAAALSVAAGAVRADEPFDTFKSLCLDTLVNAEAALAKADSLGWQTAPTDMVADFTAGRTRGQGQGQGRGVRRGTDHLVLITSEAGPSIMGPGVGADRCTLYSTETADQSTLNVRLGDWTGTPPVQMGSDSVWLFTDEQGQRQSAADLIDLSFEDSARFVEIQPVYILVGSVMDGMTMMELGRMRKF